MNVCLCRHSASLLRLETCSWSPGQSAERSPSPQRMTAKTMETNTTICADEMIRIFYQSRFVLWSLSLPTSNQLTNMSQRIALYATVRRRYMDHERQRVLANAPTNSAPNPKPAADRRESNRPLISRTKPSKSAADSSSKPQCCDCAGVFMYVHSVLSHRFALKEIRGFSVDGTTGPEVKVHKHSTQCSTPWR